MQMQIVLIQYYLSINPNQCELWVMKPLSASETLQRFNLQGFVRLVQRH